MARFDLYDNSDDEMRRLAPYLLDVQSTHVGILPTRIVTPLRPTLDLGFQANRPIYCQSSRSTARKTP